MRGADLRAAGALLLDLIDFTVTGRNVILGVFKHAEVGSPPLIDPTDHRAEVGNPFLKVGDEHRVAQFSFALMKVDVLVEPPANVVEPFTNRNGQNSFLR